MNSAFLTKDWSFTVVRSICGFIACPVMLGRLLRIKDDKIAKTTLVGRAQGTKRVGKA